MSFDPDDPEVDRLMRAKANTQGDAVRVPIAVHLPTSELADAEGRRRRRAADPTDELGWSDDTPDRAISSLGWDNVDKVSVTGTLVVDPSFDDFMAVIRTMVADMVAGQSANHAMQAATVDWYGP